MAQIIITVPDANKPTVDEALRAYLGEAANGLTDEEVNDAVIKQIMQDIVSRNEKRKAVRAKNADLAVARQAVEDQLAVEKQERNDAEVNAEAAVRTIIQNVSTQIV